MSADTRSVHTDALSTLGKIIGPSEKRDAIHLAVEPVTAGQTLYPGQEINIMYVQNKPVAHPAVDGKATGIVDPFLKNDITQGQMFWMILRPRQIASLRHVWSHPDFREPVPDEVERLQNDLALALADNAELQNQLDSSTTNDEDVDLDCRSCY